MITTIFIILIAVFAVVYVALPLITPKATDPLPDDRDPVLLDLVEERDALYRAIQELSDREDLPTDRKTQLRTRYEAKAAGVLNKIDAREAQLAGRAPRVGAPARRSATWPTVAMLAALVAMALALPTFVLPRIGQDATVTTTDIPAAQRIVSLREETQKNPSVDAFGALADAYLEVGEVELAEQALMRALDMSGNKAAVYQRLAVIYLQRDLREAQHWLELAREESPTDPDTLYFLGEVAFTLGQLPRAQAEFEALVALPDFVPDDWVTGRVNLLRDIVPRAELAAAEPTMEHLLDLGDTLWEHEQYERALEAYYRVLIEHDADHVHSLARAGQAIGIAGRADDAASVIQRAALLAGGVEHLEQSAILMLADAEFELENYEQAAEAYGLFIEQATQVASTVRDRFASATALAAGLPDPAAERMAVAQVGQQVFQLECAQCHGPSGEGGIGTRLAGNPRAANESNVLSAVRFGRGSMPGFMGTLSDDEITAVTEYVRQNIAGAR